jgi:hypothetical protein
MEKSVLNNNKYIFCISSALSTLYCLLMSPYITEDEILNKSNNNQSISENAIAYNQIHIKQYTYKNALTLVLSLLSLFLMIEILVATFIDHSVMLTIGFVGTIVAIVLWVIAFIMYITSHHSAFYKLVPLFVLPLLSPLCLFLFHSANIVNYIKT